MQTDRLDLLTGVNMSTDSIERTTAVGMEAITANQWIADCKDDVCTY